MGHQINIIGQFVLQPVLLLIITGLIYVLTRKLFPRLRLGFMFFSLGFSWVGHDLLRQLKNLEMIQIVSLYEWLDKIFIIILIFSAAIIVLKTFDEIIFDRYLLKKAHTPIPTLFRDIIIFLGLFIIVLIVMRFEFGFNLTGLLTSSAILSVVIGLALQDTLSNIISGIVLHIEKPFRIGDWIKTGGNEGEVVEMSWRATRLKTLDGSYIVIPNINISKETILNYYAPARDHAIIFQIGLEYHASPQQVKDELLKCVLDSAYVLKTPEPTVRIINFGDYAVQYEVKIWIEDHSIYKQILDDVMTKIWYRLKRQNIQIPFPVHTVLFHKSEESKAAEPFSDRAARQASIKKIGLFQGMSEADLVEVAERSRIKRFSHRERIIVQGEEGDSLYVVLKGHVGIMSDDGKGNTIPIKDLKEGEYFGEMSLLTGEKRSATVVAHAEVTVLEIASADLLPVLQDNPYLMEGLSRVLAERKLTMQSVVDQAIQNGKVLEKETLSKTMFNRIKAFFSDQFGLSGNIGKKD